MGVGARIAEYLSENDIQQKQLSSAIKIQPPKLNLMLKEKRRISVEELENICWALDVGPEKFLKPNPPGQKIKKGA